MNSYVFSDKLRYFCKKFTTAMRKIIITLLTLVTLAASAANEKMLPGSNAGASYTGRTEVKADGSVSYDWTGVYVQTDFTGGYLAIDVSEAGESWHNLFIDGQWVRKLHITGNTPQRIILAQRLSKGTHRLRLQKCTEGQYGCTTIHHFILAKNGTMSPVAPKERMIEVYGDSYTCGYGAEGHIANERFRVDTENCDQAYGCIIARYFDADYALTAHSGQGMVRDWGDEKQISEKSMSTRYTLVYDDHGGPEYGFSDYQPQLVMINLGTNDFSPVAIPTDEQYVNAYLKMISTIRSHYKGVKILCITPHSAGRYLRAALSLLRERTLGMEDVYMANPLDGMVTEARDMGADWHPNYQGQKKIAMSLIPQISAIMGWELNDRRIE